MEAGKTAEKFRVEEWSIDNFSFWSYAVHGLFITSYNPFIDLDLFPRGDSGNGERLVVRLRCNKCIVFSGDVSFIGSDGSLLCTQKLSSKREISTLHVVTELKFEDVVNEIRKNRILRKDRLTLRFRLRSQEDTTVYRGTIIEVYDASFKISPKLLDNLNSISLLRYHFGDEQLILEVSKSRIDYSKRVLTLQPVSLKKDILVITRMSVLKNEKVVRNEENEYVFRNTDTWTFSNSLKMEEITKNQFCLDLNLKIIPSTKYTQCFHFALSEIHPEMVASMPTNRPGLPSTSNSEKKFSKSLTSTDPIQTYSSTTVLAKELMCLYQDHDFSDIQLKSGTVSFPVHKNILSARSPVFKTMLSSDMREAASGEVVIGDLDPSTLARFLAFLYTGTVEDLECDSALKLYYASDKYQVQTLKEECTSFLMANISNSNVGDVLSLSSKHQDDRLLTVVHDFILKNYNELLGSEEWKKFLRSEPLLVAETLSSLFAEKK